MKSELVKNGVWYIYSEGVSSDSNFKGKKKKEEKVPSVVPKFPAAKGQVCVPCWDSAFTLYTMKELNGAILESLWHSKNKVQGANNFMKTKPYSHFYAKSF